MNGLSLYEFYVWHEQPLHLAGTDGWIRVSIIILIGLVVLYRLVAFETKHRQRRITLIRNLKVEPENVLSGG
jgi:hypothetical protein